MILVSSYKLNVLEFFYRNKLILVEKYIAKKQQQQQQQQKKNKYYFENKIMQI